MLRPGSTQLIYLWPFKQTIKQMSLNRENDKKNIYVLDMHNIEDYPNFTDLNDWYLLFANSLSTNAGDNIFNSLNTIFPLNVYNRPQAGNHKYTSAIKFVPVMPVNGWNYEVDDLPIDTKLNETYQLLVDIVKIPFFPVYIASTVPSHISYGPAFLQNFSLSTSGLDDVGPVNINTSFVGGKYIDYPYDVVDSADGDYYDPVNFSQIYSYRGYNLRDCNVYGAVGPETLEEKDIITGFNIIEMNLSIANDYNFVVTCNNKSDELGPKFVNLVNRTITGSVTIFSKDNSYQEPRSNMSLTMDFGGPFVFTMNNIDFQEPTSDLQAGRSYTHTYNFIAKTPDNTKIIEYDGASHLSEFEL